MPVELNGAFWVWMFFSLSGFLVGEAFLDGRYNLSAKGYFSFLWNRSLRILPLYYTALCFGFIFEFVASPDELNALQVIQQYLFISPANSIPLSGPLWAVAVIVHFYILSILFVWVIAKVTLEKRPALLLSLFVLSIVIISGLQIKSCGYHFGQPRTLIDNFHFFIWGILLSVINWERMPRISSLHKYGAVFILIMIAWYGCNWKLPYFWGLGGPLSRYVALSGGALCALSIVFIILMREPDGNHRGKESKWLTTLAWCGYYSYGIYVCHSILGKANQLFFHLEPGIIRFVFLLLSLPVAFLSYKLMEAPLLQFRMGETASHYSQYQK